MSDLDNALAILRDHLAKHDTPADKRFWLITIGQEHAEALVAEISALRGRVEEAEATISKVRDIAVSARSLLMTPETAVSQIHAAVGGGTRTEPRPSVNELSNLIRSSHIFDGVNAGAAAELIAQWFNDRAAGGSTGAPK